MGPRLRARLGSVAVGDGLPVALVGALNVSPESFYKGSVHVHADDLLRAADAMVAAGAQALDVGGMSTAPYLPTEVTEAEETARLATAVARLVAKVPVPVSADTTRSGPARAALDAGATIVNDVSGLRGDPAMAALVGARGASLILMASPPGKGPATGPLDAPPRPPVEVVAGLLAESLAIARAAGIPDERIVLDPGIGFFRSEPIEWYRWDCAVLAHLPELRRLGRPLVLAVSRKSFVGALTGHGDPGDRLAGSLAATAAAVLAGAAALRTHDVAATRDAVRVAAAIRDA